MFTPPFPPYLLYLPLSLPLHHPTSFLHSHYTLPTLSSTLSPTFFPTLSFISCKPNLRIETIHFDWKSFCLHTILIQFVKDRVRFEFHKSLKIYHKSLTFVKVYTAYKQSATMKFKNVLHYQIVELVYVIETFFFCHLYITRTAQQSN